MMKFFCVSNWTREPRLDLKTHRSSSGDGRVDQ